MFCSFCGAENSDTFKFCSSCGKQKDTRVDSVLNTSEEKIQFVLRPQRVVVSLENEKKWDFELCDMYKAMVNSKNFDDVIFDAIFTDKRVLLRPVSKSPSHVWMLGALVSPAVAKAADLLGKKVSSFLSESSTNLVGMSIDVEILNSLPAWRNDCLYKVEYSLPSFMSAAGTVLSFDGISNVSSFSAKSRLHLAFDGSAMPSKKQFLEFAHIAKLCNFDVSRAKKF